MDFRFVVRSTNAEAGPGKQMDFHLVDLREKKINMDYFPSIQNGFGIGMGNMVCFHRNIVILGGDFGPQDEENRLRNHPNPNPNHLGASLYSITHNHWKPLRLPANRAMPNPAIISGNMYCFGSPYLRPEVFEYGGFWNKLECPAELEGLQVSVPVVTDYKNSRILVYVSALSHLYAFSPPKKNDGCYLPAVGSSAGTWSRIATNISVWSDVVAVADDVIYFHEWDLENLLRAYDLRSHTWVQVVADLSRVQIAAREFDRLFTLPHRNGFMCLASWVPLRPLVNNDPPSVHFLRFRVRRTADHIILTAFDYQSYPIPSADTVCDFIML